VTINEAVALLIGVVVTGLVRWLADRYPTAAQRRRRTLEDRLLEAQIENIEHENDERH